MSTAAEASLINDEDYFTSAPLTSAPSIPKSSYRLIPNITKVDDIVGVIVKAINLPTSFSSFSYKIQPQAGLLDAIGAWEDYEDIDGFINEVYKKREKSLDRTVDI